MFVPTSPQTQAGKFGDDPAAHPELDWRAAAAVADAWSCSIMQRYLLDLVLGLVQPDEEYVSWQQGCEGTRLFDLRNLGRFGSWQEPVAVVCIWAR